MSWIFAAFGNISEEENLKFNKIQTKPLFNTKTDNSYISIGNNPDTIIFDITPATSITIAGIPIKTDNFDFEILKILDWKELLKNQSLSNIIESLSGHFVGIIKSENSVVFFTDYLGVRDLYFTQFQNKLIISSRIDWIAQAIGGTEFDFKYFSSHPLLHNQISQKSILMGINRLCGGIAVFNLDDKKLDITTFNQKPSIINTNFDFDDYFIKFGQFISKLKPNVELALSGGLDSRLLLAAFKAGFVKNVTTFTYGDPNHPDATIAKKLADAMNLEHIILNDELPLIEDNLNEIKEFICQNTYSGPISEFAQMRYFPQLNKQNYVHYDGGFGEILRRSFYNNLIFKYPKAIQTKNFGQILKMLEYPRFDVFTREFKSEMYINAENELNETFKLMEGIEYDNLENWLDNLAWKLRLPNYFGREQARIDNKILGFTPFTQKILFDNFLNMPLEQRKNDRYFKGFIKKYAPELVKIPIVKRDTLAPFYMSTLQYKIMRKIKVAMGLNYKSQQSLNFLLKNKKYIVNLLYQMLENKLFYIDSNSLNNKIKAFDQRNEFASEIDWLVSFEIFRKQIYSQK